LLLFGDVTAPSTTTRASLDHSTSAGQRLLLVEDNEDNRTIYSTVLRYLGYEVVEAVDGLQAVALARSEHPDLILMDISIPGMDGWEATRLLRQDPATQEIPIIALTAHALPDDRKRATEVGFTSYLAKPIEPNAVVAEVRRLLGGNDGPRAKSGD
jgi:two-component system, cell cycle response regulator DivK